MVERGAREILHVVEIGGLQFLPVPENDGLFHVLGPSRNLLENSARRSAPRAILALRPDFEEVLGREIARRTLIFAAAAYRLGKYPWFIMEID
jgi:predicted ATPase with chaperone activity